MPQLLEIKPKSAPPSQKPADIMSMPATSTPQPGRLPTTSIPNLAKGVYRQEKQQQQQQPDMFIEL